MEIPFMDTQGLIGLAVIKMDPIMKRNLEIKKNKRGYRKWDFLTI